VGGWGTKIEFRAVDGNVALLETIPAIVVQTIVKIHDFNQYVRK
jgi:hypothetical protein